MKKIILTVLYSLLLVLSSIQAQITITSATFPQAGDTLRTVLDGMPSNIVVNPTGGNIDQDWNFSGLTGITTERIYLDADDGENSMNFPNADLVTSFGPAGENYYRLTDNYLEWVGYQGPDPANLGINLAVNLDPFLREQRAPLDFVDTYSEDAAVILPFSADQIPGQVLDSLEVTPDSIRLRITIDRSGVVDGWGSLTIPGGTYEVLREKRTEETETRLDVKVGIGPFATWVDITDIVPFFEFIGKDTTTTYRFLNDVEKEPIAIVTVDNEDNDIVQLVEYKYNDATTNINYVNNGRPDILAYPNPAISDVRFEFWNLPSGKYTLKIYNILGVVVWEKKYNISENKTEKIDLSQFRKGTYLYSLVNASGKTITTKRLMVMRP